jgi:hypothetical protein
MKTHHAMRNPITIPALMFFLFLAFVMTLVLTSSTVVASDSNVPVKVSGWVVQTLQSSPGESEQDFVVDVAQYLNTWTAKTGFDACGPIVVNKDKQYEVTLITQRSQLFCYVNIEAPNNFALTGDSIHSNPNVDENSFKLNHQDKILLSQIYNPSYVKAFEKASHIRVVSCEFSNDDVENGAGYLVACGKLLYQDGKNTSHVVYVFNQTS